MTQYTAPTVDASVPWEIRRHLQMFYTNMTDTNQAFSVLQGQIAKLKTGNTTTVTEGGSGGSSTPSTSTGIVVNNQSGVTSYTTMSGDNGALIVLSDASPIAVSLAPQTPPFGCFICNQGAGTATLTPAAIGAMTPTISYTGNPGAASMPLLSGYGSLVGFDGSNWWALTMPIVPLGFGAISHEFMTAYNATSGVFSAAQPAFNDISGIAAPSQLPTPTASTIGGVESIGPVAHEWINEIDTSGVPHLGQPAFADISGVATTAQIGTGTPSAGEYVDGGTGAWTALPVDVLSGTTAAMGGSPMTVGQTITSTATVTGATTSMVAMCSPATYPGDGFDWDCYVSAADTVTARLTCVLAGTPVSSVYNCRVLK